MSTTTTYMLLVIPDVSSTIGPDWATLLNEALQRIDQHDHSTDNGTQINLSAINVNTDFDLNNYSLENVNAAFLKDQAASLASSNVGCLYRVGSNLYYNNGSGTAVQITSGASVNASGSGVIEASIISSYPYTILTGDAQKVLIIDTTSARTLTLPAATNSMFVMIKDGNGSAQTNNITITPDGTDAIDGVSSSYLMKSNYQSIGLVSDGVSNWYVV